MPSQDRLVILDNEILIRTETGEKRISLPKTASPEVLSELLAEHGVQVKYVTQPLAIRIQASPQGLRVVIGILSFGVFSKVHSGSGLCLQGNTVHVPAPGAIDSLGKYLLGHYGIQGEVLTLPQLFKLRLNPPTFPVIDEVDVYSETQDSEGEPRSDIWEKLYGYQKTGFRFLNFASENGSGCILGDEMGLGKTLQIIALLQFQLQSLESSKRALVVMPATLVANWQRELRKFAPSLSFHVHYGSKRSMDPRLLQNESLVLTTYETLVNDLLLFDQYEWDYCVLDEAQNIKNPSAARTQAAKSLRRRVSIAVTGTPFENHVTDVWSLADFVMPGVLGPISTFEALHDDDIDSARRINRAIKSFVIRRLVLDVREDLPEKVEVDEALSPPQNVLDRQDEIAASGSKASSLTRLLLSAAHSDQDCSQEDFEQSPKVVRLQELLEEIYLEGQRAIVFTSFRNSAERLIKWHTKVFPGKFVALLNGGTAVSERQNLVDALAEKADGCLILNPTAGGVGLNITSANHVIHFNPEWNPAKTDQATARAYRGGQALPVMVHHFFYEGTVEELVVLRQASKRVLAGEAVPVAAPEMSMNDVVGWVLNQKKNVRGLV